MPTIRTPKKSDAAAIHALVSESEALEANSLYAYLLICSHFASTSVVAIGSDGIDGFVAGYRPPTSPGAVFVWQVGVREQARRSGLATKLLQALLDLPACRDLRFLEATVAPSNHASDRLFRGVARERGVTCEVEDFFTAESFGDQAHEDEQLYRIGPLAHGG